jgi:Fic family protein
MSYSSDQPYNDLPLLPPDPKSWEAVEVYKKLAEARAALAELKGRLPIIPNPLMLINTLVLQEAKDSSTIENILTSSDRLFKAFSSPKAAVDPATKEVLRYREALWKAFTSLHRRGNLSISLLETIFKIITGKNEGIRDRQVWIKSNGRIVYTPPEAGKVLKSKLVNWFDAALDNDSVDPLIKMAMLHYQFEAIHPFTDGNGRTGRILSVLYLCLQQLLDLPVLYLSKYILDWKNDYYRLLRKVTEQGSWKDWILYVLEGVRQTSALTLSKVNAIQEQYGSVLQRVRGEASDIYSRELIELIFSQPYCKIAFLEEMNIASRNTASKYLRRLEELGILQSESVGREVLYRNVALYELLSKT